MPAFLQCTGAAHVFVQTGGGVNPTEYLGLCKSTPTFDLVRKYREVHFDSAGSNPGDLSYQGCVANIGLDLTRFDPAVYDHIAAYPSPANVVGFEGTDPLGSIGTLMITEGVDHIVTLVFDYTGRSPKPVMALGGVPVGYRFLACMPVTDKHAEMGTQPRNISLSYLALPVYNPATGAFALYDRNIAAALTVPLS